jgi:hypothetical protein
MLCSHTYDFIVRSEDVKNSPLSMYKTKHFRHIFTVFYARSFYGTPLKMFAIVRVKSYTWPISCINLSSVGVVSNRATSVIIAGRWYNINFSSAKPTIAVLTHYFCAIVICNCSSLALGKLWCRFLTCLHFCWLVRHFVVISAVLLVEATLTTWQF